jgi:hypothetical protein
MTYKSAFKMPTNRLSKTNNGNYEHIEINFELVNTNDRVCKYVSYWTDNVENKM